VADVIAEKKTVSEERIVATCSVALEEGAVQIVIALPEPVPAGKKLVGTVSLRAVYAAAQGGE
jgi:putative hemolysin